MTAVAGRDYALIASDTRLTDGGYGVRSRKHLKGRIWSVQSSSMNIDLENDVVDCDDDVDVSMASGRRLLPSFSPPRSARIDGENDPSIVGHKRYTVDDVCNYSPPPIFVGSAGCSSDCESLKRRMRLEIDQYVADAAMHALLGVANVGLGCDGQDDYNDDDPGGMMGMGSSTSPEETVSPGDILDSCFICRSPTTKIDAKSSEHAGGHSVANLTITTEAHDIDYQAAVAVTCGDWQWITDSRNRSGWQSDQQGSLIRFRLKINKLPTLSLTYMKSHQTFGNMMVTFRALSRKEANLSPPSSLLGCDDVDKIKDLGWEGEFDFGGIYANDPSIIPALTFEGSITQYSLWETVVFPATNEYWDVNTARSWNLLNRTVLSRMMTMDSNNEYAVEYVDLYVINPSESRIKVQVVTAC